MQAAVRELELGRCVICPTETYFGMAASMFSSQGCACVYRAKKRPAGKPLPLIAADLAMVQDICDLRLVPDRLLSMWPAPLTLVVPVHRAYLAKVVPSLLDACGCVAIRVSPHPVPRTLASILGAPVTATSANVAGHEPVTQADRLEAEIRKAGYLLDLPPAPAGGLPSTILAFPARGKFLLLREGAVSRSMLQERGCTITDR